MAVKLAPVLLLMVVAVVAAVARRALVVAAQQDKVMMVETLLLQPPAPAEVAVKERLAVTVAAVAVDRPIIGITAALVVRDIMRAT